MAAPGKGPCCRRGACILASLMHAPPARSEASKRCAQGKGRSKDVPSCSLGPYERCSCGWLPNFGFVFVTGERRSPRNRRHRGRVVVCGCRFFAGGGLTQETCQPGFRGFKNVKPQTLSLQAFPPSVCPSRAQPLLILPLRLHARTYRVHNAERHMVCNR